MVLYQSHKHVGGHGALDKIWRMIMEKNVIFGAILLMGMSLGACNSSGKEDGNDADADGSTSGCEIEIDETYPESGATDMYYRGDIVVELSDADSSATLYVMDSSGGTVDGALTNEDGVLTFSPSASLDGGASYTAVVEYCDTESLDVPFTTADLGSPVTSDVDLTVNTYAVNLGDGHFVEPAGVGDLIGSLLTNNVLISITAQAETSLEVRGGISEEGNTNQDYCSQSLEDFPSVDFTQNPYFEIPEGDVLLSVAGYDVPINAFSLSGTFSEDGSYFGGATVSGELDARDVGALLGDLIDDTSPDEVCNLLLGFGVTCATCSSDGSPYCLNLIVDRLEAQGSSGALECVGITECHPECATSTCSDPNEGVCVD
jgi:hypothetical protein